MVVPVVQVRSVWVGVFLFRVRVLVGVPGACVDRALMPMLVMTVVVALPVAMGLGDADGDGRGARGAAAIERWSSSPPRGGEGP